MNDFLGAKAPPGGSLGAPRQPKRGGSISDRRTGERADPGGSLPLTCRANPAGLVWADLRWGTKADFCNFVRLVNLTFLDWTFWLFDWILRSKINKKSVIIIWIGLNYDWTGLGWIWLDWNWIWIGFDWIWLDWNSLRHAFRIVNYSKISSSHVWTRKSFRINVLTPQHKSQENQVKHQTKKSIRYLKKSSSK